MNKIKRYERFVTGESLAKALASVLVAKSCWFQVEPWPEDEWCFTLKTENEHLFDGWVDEAAEKAA